MKYNYISLDGNLFKQDGSNFRDLNYLVQILSRENTDGIARYKFFCSDVALANRAHFKALLELDQKLLQKYTDDAMLSGQVAAATRHVSNQVTAASNTTFNITEAIRFFSTPVALVLENSLNDSYFIKAIFKHFGRVDQAGTNILLSFLDSGWITFVNAGGWKNIENYIEGQKQALENFAALQMQAPEKYLRHFVLMDSDKQHEQYTDGDVERKETLSQELELLGCQVHLLQKRAMENYMPDEVIEDLDATYKTWIDAYKVLSDEQKDYLNYEKGFERKINRVKQILPRTEEKEGIQQLYPDQGEDAISDANYKILANGFKAFSFPDYKKKFPKNFWEHHHVYMSSLLNRAGGTAAENELKVIMEKIISLL